MEAIILCGIQASGKSTFYQLKFAKSHVLISLDLLNTRNKENLFLETCLKTQSKFIVDNTNPTIAERRKYIELAKEKKYKIIGYYFECALKDSIERNKQRKGKEKINEIGIKGTLAKFEIPEYSEGYDELYKVELCNNEFLIRDKSY